MLRMGAMDPRFKRQALFSLICGMLYFGYALWVLCKGHPHEDAYILSPTIQHALTRESSARHHGSSTSATGSCRREGDLL